MRPEMLLMLSKHRISMLVLQHKIYQYQEITSSTAITTVSVHYSKVNFSRIL